MIERFRTGAIIPVETWFVNSNGAGITNADGRVYIRRKSDDQYFNGTTWQTAKIHQAMTEVSETNAPGWWKYNFNTAGMAEDVFVFEVVDNAGVAVNTPQIAMALTGDIADMIVRILGLDMENYYLDNATYLSGKLTGGRIRIYNSAANVGTGTGVVATYIITATYSGDNLTTYSMVKQ